MIKLLKKLFSKEKKSPIITINTESTESQEAEQLGGDYCGDCC